MENPAPLAPRGKRYEPLAIRRQAIKFYNKFPNLFKNAVNEELALEIERLKIDKKALRDRVEQLKDAQSDLQQEMMFVCWDEHGPSQLREAMGAFNRASFGLVCGCVNCVRETDREDELPVTNSNCFLFERLRGVMEAHDITFAIDNPFNPSRDVTPGFHPNLACHGLHTVSDLNVHLVFPEPYSNPYRVYYGRKLWEVTNPFDDLDIEKLTLFQRRLHHKPLVVTNVFGEPSSSSSAES